jgi:hypothetical protein
VVNAQCVAKLSLSECVHATLRSTPWSSKVLWLLLPIHGLRSEALVEYVGWSVSRGWEANVETVVLALMVVAIAGAIVWSMLNVREQPPAN